MTRMLLINEAAKARIAQVLDHAKAHHYHPKEDAKVPGDDDRFVVQLETFRAVFSFTHLDGQAFRHLSVSVPGGLLPHPIAVFAIAGLFGFTGWNESMGDRTPPDWHAGAIENPPVVIVTQEIASQ